jgi:hypothetical protein
MRAYRPWLAAAVLILAETGTFGCSADVPTGRRCPEGLPDCVQPHGSAGGGAGGGGVSGGSGAGGAGATGVIENALSVEVQDDEELRIEILTLACEGDCADIEAVAQGGRPPYTFEWDDGSTEAARRVCLDASQDLSVTAADTRSTDPEFPHEQQTATAMVAAHVLDCSDAGPPPPRDGLCVENPSFEGTPQTTVSDATWDLPGWTMCNVTPDVNPASSQLPPTDGKTYLAMVGGGPGVYESTGAELCAPLTPGKPISFELDIAASSYIGGPTQLQLWGGTTSCATETLLWASPMITDIDMWQTHCATFTPDAAYAFMTIRPTEVPFTQSGSYLLVDNLRVVEGCE